MSRSALAITGWCLSYGMLPALLVSYLGTCTGGETDNLQVSLFLGCLFATCGLYLVWRFSAALRRFWLVLLPLPHVATFYQGAVSVPSYFLAVTMRGAHGCSVTWPDEIWGGSRTFDQPLWGPVWAALLLVLLSVILRSWSLAYRGAQHAG
jgi:hypothetical protein